MFPAIRIDAHQHFWKYNKKEYDWIDNEMKSLRRDFLPEHLNPELFPAGITGTVAVQARQTLEETNWLLSLAEMDNSIQGVVGWVDLRAKDARYTLDHFASHRLALGVRHVLQDEEDDLFMLHKDFLQGIAALQERNLTYDLLINPHQLAAARELVTMFPGQKFVLDHMGKPPVKKGLLSPWEDQLRNLALSPNVFCKLSGLVTEADWRNWKESDINPYLDIACEAFGEDRVMFGSDWPVCTVAASYGEITQLIDNFVSSRSPDAARKIMGLNAACFYGFSTGNM